jgi:hypothetical protein
MRFTSVLERLLRQGRSCSAPVSRRPLPRLPGRPIVDTSDISVLLAALDDERRAGREPA